MSDPRTVLPALLAAGALFVFGAGILQFARDPSARFRRWPTVTAEILSDSLTEATHTGRTSSRRGSTFRTWQLDITFSYEYSGIRYTGTRAAPQRIRSLRLFTDGPASEALLAIQQRHRPGMKTMAYVNPDDPTETYLLGWRPLADQYLGWLGMIGGALLLLIARRMFVNH